MSAQIKTSMRNKMTSVNRKKQMKTSLRNRTSDIDGIIKSLGHQSVRHHSR